MLCVETFSGLLEQSDDLVNDLDGGASFPLAFSYLFRITTSLHNKVVDVQHIAERPCRIVVGESERRGVQMSVCVCVVSLSSFPSMVGVNFATVRDESSAGHCR